MQLNILYTIIRNCLAMNKKGKIMSALNEFPQSAQEQILHYLETDNFPAAKELYDYFLSRKDDHDEDID